MIPNNEVQNNDFQKNMPQNTEPKRKNKGLIITIIILCLAVVGLGGYIVYDKLLQKDDNTNDKDNEDDENEKEYTMAMIAGKYKFSKKLADPTISIELTLNEDGTASLIAGDGYAAMEVTEGTYTIVEDEITYTRTSGYGKDGEINTNNKTEGFKIVSETAIKLTAPYFSEYDYDELATLNKEEIEANKMIGTFKIIYKDPTSEVADNKASTITLKSDNTFTFNANLCAGMIDIQGKYTISNNKMTFNNLKSDYPDMIEEQFSTIQFTIVSNDEFYLNDDSNIGCTIDGNKDGSFIKQ